MLNLNKLKNNSELPILPYDTGGKLELLNLSEQKEEIAYMMLRDSSPITKNPRGRPRKNTSTVESHAGSKKKISKDKSITSKQNTPPTKQSKTSQVALISKEKGSRGYWLSQCQAMSKKLWLPTETGSVGLPGNISNGCLPFTESVSLLKINKNIHQNPNSEMTSSLSSTFSPHDTMLCGGTTHETDLKTKKQALLQKQENQKHGKLKKKILKEAKEDEEVTIPEREIVDPVTNNYITISKKIRVVPVDRSDRRKINDVYAVSRKLWNICVHYVQTHPNETITETQLRNLFVIRKHMSKTQLRYLHWTFRISKREREQVIMQFVANYKTAKKNFKVRKPKPKKKSKKKKVGTKDKKRQRIRLKKDIVMRTRDKNDPEQTILLSSENSFIIGKTFHCLSQNVSKGASFRLTENYSEKIDRNVILKRIGTDYFLCIPQYKNILKKSTPDRIISIDNGFKTFATYYCPDGEWGEIGNNYRNVLNRLYDKEESIEKHVSSKNRKNEALSKIKRRIMNIRDDIHWKLCHWLLSQYRVILIPRLYVSKMDSQTMKHQRDMKHCLFVDRLIHKSLEYKDSEIHVCKEHYTTMACTKCQSVNTTQDTVVHCNDCDCITHRDLSGARNIMLKHVY